MAYIQGYCDPRALLTKTPFSSYVAQTVITSWLRTEKKLFSAL